jgi:hypothetical protein
MPRSQSKYPEPRGDSKISDIIKELRREVRRNRIMPSAGVLVTSTENGTVLQMLKKGGGGGGGEAVWL